jgi:hypothetical protein
MQSSTRLEQGTWRATTVAILRLEELIEIDNGELNSGGNEFVKVLPV